MVFDVLAAPGNRVLRAVLVQMVFKFARGAWTSTWQIATSDKGLPPALGEIVDIFGNVVAQRAWGQRLASTGESAPISIMARYEDKL